MSLYLVDLHLQGYAKGTDALCIHTEALCFHFGQYSGKGHFHGFQQGALVVFVNGAGQPVTQSGKYRRFPAFFVLQGRYGQLVFLRQPQNAVPTGRGVQQVRRQHGVHAAAFPWDTHFQRGRGQLFQRRKKGLGIVEILANQRVFAQCPQKGSICVDFINGIFVI